MTQKGLTQKLIEALPSVLKHGYLADSFLRVSSALLARLGCVRLRYDYTHDVVAAILREESVAAEFRTWMGSEGAKGVADSKFILELGNSSPKGV